MRITENFSGVPSAELFAIAERENNSRRRNLIVNYKQAKHVPTRPSEAARLFDRLAARIIAAAGDDRCLVIGFAETATAIAAHAAIRLGGMFIHTTRENYPSDMLAARFSEEHSHASAHFLYARKGEKIFENVRKIIFIDDELTTGKTVINFIDSIAHCVSPHCRFFAASVINGMSKDDLNAFEQRGITLAWLIKTEYAFDTLNRRLDITPAADAGISCSRTECKYTDMPPLPDPRLGTGSAEYGESCRSFCETLFERIEKICGNRIDVIGTEECMYPALCFALFLEEKGCDVRCHSTTRSPIVASADIGYPLFSRSSLPSFYDEKRITYIYNLYQCDTVVLITDTPHLDERTAEKLRSIVNCGTLIIVNG